MKRRRGRALSRRYGHYAMRFSHQDIVGLLTNSPRRPASERELRMNAAAFERGYAGKGSVASFLEGIVYGGGG